MISWNMHGKVVVGRGLLGGFNLPLFECFPLLHIIKFKSLNFLNFFNETIILFLKKRIINEYFIIINGSKNIKCFVLKMLPNSWKTKVLVKYQLSICLKQISSNQKCLILQNHFQLDSYCAFPNAIVRAEDRVNLNTFAVVLPIICQTTQYIVLIV